MGSDAFMCTKTGEVAAVKYTFGYKHNEDGMARIVLHHYSMPDSAPPGPKPVAHGILDNSMAG